MKTPDRAGVESLLIDLLMEKKTRHEAAQWARAALEGKKRIDDVVLEEIVQGLCDADAGTGNPSRPWRVTEDALSNWLRRLSRPEDPLP